MSKLQEAFDELVKELARLYGAGHNHDFQDELDVLQAAIKQAEEKINEPGNKPAGRPVTGQTSPVK